MQGDQTPRATSIQEIGTDEQLGKLYMAIATAQSEFEEIHRTKTVNVRMKEGGAYSFAYAPLEDLLAATRKALTSNGLAVMTPIARDGGDAKIVTILAHKDGARIISTFAFPPKQDIKELAGQITYLRRYSYSAMLNLAADDDDDDKGNRNISEDRRPTGPVRAPAPNRGSQQPATPTGANSSRPVSQTPQADGELPSMIQDMGDPDYVWMLRVQEAAKEVGIPTSAVKLPTRRLSLISTANSLMRAVNNARTARGMDLMAKPAEYAAAASEYAPDGEDDDPHDEPEPYATAYQIGAIEEIVKARGLKTLVDPETEEAWVFEDTDLLILTETEAERMLELLRDQTQEVPA